MKTTGQKIVAASDSQLTIGIDMGQYEDTVEALNVRKIKTLHAFDRPGASAVFARIQLREHDNRYGMGWGGINALYPITEQDEADIIAEYATRDATVTSPVSETRLGVCPKCHTYCYGDCDASR